MKSLTRNEKCTTAVVAVLTAGICASLLGPTPATAASPSEADLLGRIVQLGEDPGPGWRGSSARR